MTKLLVGVLGLLVAVMGFGSLTASTTQAAPTAIVTVNCSTLAQFIDGDADDVTDGADLTAACDGAGTEGNISEAEGALIAGAIGDEDGVVEASDFDDEEIADLDADQVDFDGDLELEFIVIVNDDDPITVDPKVELSFVEETGADGDLGCGIGDDALTEEDCDNDGTAGDRALWLTIFAVAADGASAGDDVSVVATQDGVSLSQTIHVVGNPDEITLTAVESTIQEGAASTCAGDGGTPAVTDDEALSDVETTILIAVVTDSQGTELTFITVAFDVDDDDIADVGDRTGATVDAGDSGTAAFAVLCGGDPGVVTVTAEFDDVEDESDSVEVTVVGEPANVALTASPAAIACDGTATSTVSATVTDSEGNNVVNGTTVTFSVVALGTANPINTSTTDGVASSTITPLSGATAGVTVIVSSGDASASIRVDCLPELATPVGPQPTPTGGTGVTPPDTGTGGYLGQDSSAGFPLWTLVALALGSFALVAGGMVTRRAGR